MYSIKPGRGPSAMGAVGSVIAIVFGIGWTILAFNITKDAPFPIVGIIFPLFGVLFVIIGIVQFAYNVINTTARNRMSALDVTTGTEEPDPLNQIFGNASSGDRPGESRTPEERLCDLDGLRSKGLISETEYTAQRQRIIGEV